MYGCFDASRDIHPSRQGTPQQPKHRRDQVVHRCSMAHCQGSGNLVSAEVSTAQKQHPLAGLSQLA